jgi:Predicted secreted hydrolase
VSLHLSDGSALTVYQLRHDSGEHYISGSWLATVFPYWEGPVRVQGSHQGVGYLELTGY